MADIGGGGANPFDENQEEAAGADQQSGQRLYKVQFVISQHGRLEVANFVASTHEEAIANFIQKNQFFA
jgi:hypothetical protein